MVEGPYFRKESTDLTWGTEANEYLAEHSLAACTYKDGYLYEALQGDDTFNGEAYGFESLTLEQVYNYLGEPNDYEITYQDVYPDPEPYPEPDPVDPTMSQLVNIIVETSVNVDYLVSMQSFQ